MVANKSPAFQFYPADYLTDYRTVGFSVWQHGAYIVLLSYDWLNDGIPNNIGSVKGMLRVPLTDDLGSDLGAVLSLFSEHPEKPNMVTNPRLREEREKQKSFKEQAREAGKRGGRRAHDSNIVTLKEEHDKETEFRELDERVRLGSVKGTPNSHLISSHLINSTSTKVEVHTNTPPKPKVQKQDPSPVLPDCEYFRATDRELETAKSTWIKNGNDELDFRLAIAEVEFWLGTESPKAKAARKANSHARQLHAAWVVENISRKHEAHRKKQGRIFPQQHQLTGRERRHADLMQLIAETEPENEQPLNVTPRIL